MLNKLITFQELNGDHLIQLHQWLQARHVRGVIEKTGFKYERDIELDAEYGILQDDIPFFKSLIKVGSILDLACGTGRLTIPFALSGFKVTGLDLSLPMLECAKKKAKDLEINWILGDLRDFNLEEKFDLITMGGNSFQALLTKSDQLKFFTCVKDHLKYNGLFAFVTRNPEVEDLANVSDDFSYWHAFRDFNGSMVKVYGKHTYDNQSEIAKYYTKRIWDEKETITEICLRYTSCKEIMSLL